MARAPRIHKPSTLHFQVKVPDEQAGRMLFINVKQNDRGFFIENVEETKRKGLEKNTKVVFNVECIEAIRDGYTAAIDFLIARAKQLPATSEQLIDPDPVPVPETEQPGSPAPEPAPEVGAVTDMAEAVA